MVLVEFREVASFQFSTVEVEHYRMFLSFISSAECHLFDFVNVTPVDITVKSLEIIVVICDCIDFLFGTRIFIHVFKDLDVDIRISLSLSWRPYKCFWVHLLLVKIVLLLLGDILVLLRNSTFQFLNSIRPKHFFLVFWF